MKADKNAIGIGLMLGAAIGAVWVASRARDLPQTRSRRLIDWSRVQDIALSLNREPGIPREWKETIAPRYLRMVEHAAGLVSDYTGTNLTRPLSSIHVFDRRDWIMTNIANFESLFEPLEQMHFRSSKNNSAATALLNGANQLVLSGEMGLLLGYLAKRVLGQYDLSLLGKEALTTGRLYFVEPNIAGIQKELDLSPSDFRLWIVLHETTHAHEFEAHPWLRDHFNSILAKYFEHLDQDLKHLRMGSHGLKALVDRVADGLADHQRWVELVMTREQRQTFRHMQALMCVIEGYSNHVMNAVGKQLLPTYDLIRQRVEQRQTQKNFAERIFTRITGLDIKLEQYRLGERFVEQVVRREGIDFMNKVWEKPENIPSLPEVEHPEKWIRRLSG